MVLGVLSLQVVVTLAMAQYKIQCQVSKGLKSNLGFAAELLWISFKSLTSDFQSQVMGSDDNLLYC